MYSVYQIEFKGTIVYIGMTNDLTRRQYQHNRACFDLNKDKEIYNFLRENGATEIELELFAEFGTKVEAKRMECYLILQDYFGEKNLKQKVPSISDR